MNKSKIASVVAAPLGVGNAFASNTGNGLLTDLQRTGTGLEVGAVQWVAGYLSGMADSNINFKCRDRVTKGQIADVVRLHLERNPANRDSSAGMEVYLAAAMAGICRYDKAHG